MKRYFTLFFLITTFFNSCIVQSGSFNSATNYYGHFEGSGTGQAMASFQLPYNSHFNSTLVGSYSLTKHIYAQGSAAYNSILGKENIGYGKVSNFSSQAMLGLYGFKRGYQCLSIGIGGGFGNTSIVKHGFSFGDFKVAYTNAQIGVSENYGRSRLSLGLSHKAVSFYKGKVYITSDLDVLRGAQKLENDKVTHTLSSHLGWSVRLQDQLRMYMAYDFTFYGRDYGLYDRDSFRVGLMKDIGKMSRPAQVPKLPKNRKSPKKKKVYDAHQTEDDLH